MSGIKVPQTEYTKTNSIYSAMRLAFLRVVKFWIILTASTAAIISGSAIANAFLPKEKQINIPTGALIGLSASVGTIAFGGKALQSFSEPNAPEIDTMAPKDETSQTTNN